MFLSVKAFSVEKDLSLDIFLARKKKKKGKVFRILSLIKPLKKPMQGVLKNPLQRGALAPLCFTQTRLFSHLDLSAGIQKSFLPSQKSLFKKCDQV